MNGRDLTVREMFQRWVRQWGGNLATHETEICSDIVHYAHDLDAALKGRDAVKLEAVIKAARQLIDPPHTVYSAGSKKMALRDALLALEYPGHNLRIQTEETKGE